MAATWRVPANAWDDRARPTLVHAGTTAQPTRPGGRIGARPPWQRRIRRAPSRLVPSNLPQMSNPNLDRLLSAVNDFDASDLHLVAGVPPAFRVNGEIIIADEDALSDEQISEMV